VDEWTPAEARIGKCTWHHASDEGVVTVWPEEYRTWAATRAQSPIGKSRSANLDIGESGNRAIGGSGNRGIGESGGSLTISNPLGGATYLFDPTLRAAFQTLKLQARGATGDVTWDIDGVRFASAAADRAVEWPLALGQHQIVVTDATGAQARTKVTVR